MLAVVAGVAVLVLPLGLACTAILAAYLVSMGVDPETVALPPFGPSQVGRFYGVNNLLETMLLAPALMCSSARPLGDRRRRACVRDDRRNRFGADGGGMVVLAAAYLVLLLRLRGHLPSLRLVAPVARGDRPRAAPARARRGDRWLEPRHRCRRRRPGGARARHRRPGRALGAPHRRRRRGHRRRPRLARDPDHACAPGPTRTRARRVSRGPGGLAPCQRHSRATCSESAPQSRSSYGATRLSASR